MLERLRLIQRAHRYRNRHDPHEIRALIAAIPKGGTALDIGAHKGAYSYWMAKAVGRSGRLVSVEPQPDLVANLADLFAPRHNVCVLHGAVTDHEGSVTLNIPGSVGPSHGASIRTLEGAASLRRETVPARTLESIVRDQDLTRLDAIKCDCEGAEREIFEAGRGVLDRFGPAVLVECEQRHAGGDEDPVGELWAVFKGLGYSGVCFCGGERVDIESFDYATHQRDPDDKANYGNNFFFTRQP